MKKNVDFLIVDCENNTDFSIINSSGVVLNAEHVDDNWVLRIKATDSALECLFIDVASAESVSRKIRDFCKISSLRSQSQGFFLAHIDPDRTVKNKVVMNTLRQALGIDDDSLRKLRLPFRYLLERTRIIDSGRISLLESVIGDIHGSRGRVIAAYMCIKQAKKTTDGFKDIADSLTANQAGIYVSDGVYYFVDGDKNAVNIKRSKESYDIHMVDDDIVLKEVSQKDAQAVMRELANVKKWHVVCMPDQETLIRNLCHELLVDFELDCVVADDIDHIKPTSSNLSAHAYAIMCFNKLKFA